MVQLATPADCKATPPHHRTPRPTRALWRLRWFWRWQAWRARRRQANDASNGIVQYESFNAIEYLGYSAALFALHQSLATSTPGVLADGSLALRRRLERELSKPATAVMLGAPDGSLGGYAWGRVGHIRDALQHYQQVQSLGHLRADDWQTIGRRAANQCGNEPILALYGIGLAPAWRKGFGPLRHLLKPLLELGLSHQATRALWWVPCTSSLYGMSLAFGARLLHESAACAVFLLPDTRPLARLFAALPASAIADLLAKVAPSRPPQPASTPRSAAFARAHAKHSRDIAA